MDPLRIFYSWQSDRDRAICGRFVAIALQTALNRLSDRMGIQLLLDSDTKGVAGTPPVSETILRKIRECDIFVGDVTFVARTDRGKRLPNPNVMFELGYARSLLADERIILVMNEVFGAAKQLPFDLAHLRHPTRYSLAEEAADPERRKCRDAFAAKIEAHLEASLRHVLKEKRPGPANAEELAAARALLTAAEQMTGRGDVPALVPGPKLVLRMAPLAAVREPYLEPSKVKAALPQFVPDGYERALEDVNTLQWASFDPPQRRKDAVNPEARWYVRLLRPGVLEGSFMVGTRIDDDRTILVEGRPLEGRIVDTVTRFGAIAAGLGLDGPAVICASLHGLEDVQLSSSSRSSRALGIPGLSLGAVEVPIASKALPEALRPILDAIWLGTGFVDGSPSFSDDGWQGHEARNIYEPAVIGGRAWR